MSGERVRDNEWRRHQVIRAHLGRDAALKVAIAGENGNGHEAVLLDRLRDVLGQRPRVADACRAAVADHLEAQLVEIRQQSRSRVVVGDDAGAGRERGLHPRWRREAGLNRLLREQTRGDHHVRVACIRARRDRSDDDGAVREIPVGIDAETRPHRMLNRNLFLFADGRLLVRRRRDGDAYRNLRVGRTERACEVAVCGGVAALALPADHLPHFGLVCVRAQQARQHFDETLRRLAQQHAVLRALRSGDTRLHGAQIKFEPARVVGLRRVRCVEESLRLVVRLGQRDVLLAATGEAEITSASPYPPGRCRRSLRTPAPCLRWLRGPRGGVR